MDDLLEEQDTYFRTTINSLPFNDTLNLNESIIKGGRVSNRRASFLTDSMFLQDSDIVTLNQEQNILLQQTTQILIRLNTEIVDVNSIHVEN